MVEMEKWDRGNSATEVMVGIRRVSVITLSSGSSGRGLEMEFDLELDLKELSVAGDKVGGVRAGGERRPDGGGDS
jgi:hypothetical protein